MYLKEMRAIIETLEGIQEETRTTSNNPHETARLFIRAVGSDTAAQCVAAMVRRLSWDGRISQQARKWAESVALSADWTNRINDTFTTIHTAHLSQIAEAMPIELEFVEAETNQGSMKEATA